MDKPLAVVSPFVSLSVLLCTDYLGNQGGGVETVVSKLATGLVDRGFDVTIFSLSVQGSLSVPTDTVEVVSHEPFDITPYLGLQSAIAPGGLKTLDRTICRVDPDIIHVHNRFFLSRCSQQFRVFSVRKHAQ